MSLPDSNRALRSAQPMRRLVRPSPRSIIARALLAIALVTGLLPGASAQDMLTTGLLKRSASSYRSVSRMDPAICDAVLRSLNKPYQLTEEQIRADSGPNVLGDTLLSSDLQVPWKREGLWTPGLDVLISSLDFASITLSPSSPSVGLYRWTSLIANRTINSLILSNKRLNDLPPGAHRSTEAVRDIGGKEFQIDHKTIPELWKDGSGPQDQFSLLNVVAVGDKLLVLLIDSIQANDLLFRRGKAVDVYVLLIVSENRLRPMCRYRGEFVW